MLNFETVLDDVMAKARGMAGVHRDIGFSRSDVAVAFQAVYYASIRREEGEVVRPHLVLLSEESFAGLGSHAALLVANEPRPLAPELLRKRSLAFDRKATSFVATPGQDGLMLRGVAHWAWSGNKLDRRSTGLPMLRFDAEDAGTVVVAYDQTRLGLLRDGHFYPTRPNVFASAGFKKALVSTFARLQQSEDRARAFMTSLQYLVRSAMSHGLGATIVVLDDWMPIEISECTEAGESVTYALRHTQDGAVPSAIRDEVMDTEATQLELSTLAPARKAYLDLVAQLACVDGALIVGPRFTPVRYGTKLRAPACNVPVFLGGDKGQQISSVLQGVGTRHSSALNFVSHTKRSIAIAISSDGPVSTFAWLDDRLSWWRNAVDL